MAYLIDAAMGRAGTSSAFPQPAVAKFRASEVAFGTHAGVIIETGESISEFQRTYLKMVSC